MAEASSTEEIYRTHHAEKRRPGFVLLGEERGGLFKEKVGINKYILDIGCRDGSLTAYFAKGNTVLGVDIDCHALKDAEARLGIETVCMDLNGDWRELKDRTFDVVTAGEIIEHLYHPDKVVRKIRGLIKPGGMLVGSVPNAFSLKNRVRLFFARKKYTPLGDPTHINHFSYRELQHLLLQHFSSVELVPLGRFAWLDRYFPGMTSFSIAFIARV